MNYHLHLQLLMLKNEKRMLIKRYCGGDYLNKVDQSFEDIDNFDISKGTDPLEVKARSLMLHSSSLELLEQRIKNLKKRIGIDFPGHTKEAARQELEKEFNEKYGDEFVKRIEREFGDILDFDEFEGKHPLEEEARKIMEKHHLFLVHARVATEQDNFDSNAKNQWEGYILRLINKDKSAEVITFPVQDASSVEYVQP